MDYLTFRVFTRRHDSHVTYHVTKIKNGWHIKNISINGECKPDGTPFFYKNFDQDNINYPSGFSSFLGRIWSQLEGQEITDSEAQIKLQELANWVSACEKSQPQWQQWSV